MMLTDLADACRKSGLTVVEEAGWRTRGHGPMTSVSAIVCHHTAGPAIGDAPSLRVVREGRTDLPGPLAQLVLARSGTVYVVAAGLSYHAGVVFETWQNNANAVGIEAEHDGVSPWPASQLAAYHRLCRALADHYRVPVARVLGHKEVASPLGRKTDPNTPMAAFRAAVSALEGPMTVWTDSVTNMNGHQVQAIQVVNGIEVRAADVQTRAGNIEDKVNALSAQVAGLAEVLVGVEHRLTTKLNTLTAAVDEVVTVIDSLGTGGTGGTAPLDVDGLTSAFADKLAARLTD